MSREVDQRRWIVLGLSSGVTGLLFGLLLSLVTVVLLRADVGWIKLLERRGIDATMRAALLFRDADVAPRSDRGAVLPITFVDIDEAGCRRLSHSPDKCLTEGISQTSVLTPLGEALETSDAALLVLDVAMPQENEAARRTMLRTWSEGDGPPVVAALPGAAGPNGVIVFDWRSIPGATLRSGRLRYASALFPIDKRAGDDVIRHVPATVQFVALNGEPQNGTIPSLPALAAGRPAGRVPADPEAGEEPRTYFSLPSLADASSRGIRGGFLNSYGYRRLSDMIVTGDCDGTPCPPSVRATDLSGQIVIVGSSAAAAQDWHETPLGLMPGAEIVANAIRAAQAFPPLREPPLFDRFWLKAVQTLMAASFMTLAWLLIAWLRSRREQASRRRAFYTGAMVATFLAGSAVTLAYSLYLGVGEMLHAPDEGQTTDLLLPTLAVLFEGFLDFAKYVTDKLEHRVSAMLASVADRMKRSH